MRGWASLYRTSVGLGLRYLLRHGYLREAVIRVVVPLDPSRYLELPPAARELGAQPGDRVLDLASPKLLAVWLARRGVEMTSVDALDEEVARWRALTAGEPRLRLLRADGRALPFESASFDHAYSISVLEHVPEPGDALALRELTRVVRPGGRIVITLPFARHARDEWRTRPVYGPEPGSGDGRYLFQRWYDRKRLDALLAQVPEARVVRRDIVRLQPNWQVAYSRLFPALVPLGPLFGLLARECDRDGDVVRLTLERSG